MLPIRATFQHRGAHDQSSGNSTPEPAIDGHGTFRPRNPTQPNPSTCNLAVFFPSSAVSLRFPPCQPAPNKPPPLRRILKPCGSPSSRLCCSFHSQRFAQGSQAEQRRQRSATSSPTSRVRRKANPPARPITCRDSHPPTASIWRLRCGSWKTASTRRGRC